MVAGSSLYAAVDYTDPKPFGDADRWAKKSDKLAIGEWWKKPSGPAKNDRWKEAREWIQSIDRKKALAFALYTQHEAVLKLSAQCFPLLPKEPKSVVLEFKRDGKWVQADKQPVQYPGWDVHFRIKNWDASNNVAYRLRLGDLSSFEGLVRPFVTSAHARQQRRVIVFAATNSAVTSSTERNRTVRRKSRGRHRQRSTI